MRIEVPVVGGAFVIDLEVSDLVPTGDLCPTCFLPSIVRWETVWLAEDGVHPFLEHEECMECSPDLFIIEIDD